MMDAPVHAIDHQTDALAYLVASQPLVEHATDDAFPNLSNRIQVRPLFAFKDDPSDGAETGVAEPHIAEQSRSWRAASGEQEVMRGS